MRMNNFSKKIRPFVELEFGFAKEARCEGDFAGEFSYLENAHVLGQESTVLHVKAHWMMLCWGFRNSKPMEVFGQIIRLAGAATKTALGLIPVGNTGGSNVSPIKAMPLKPEHADIIESVKNKA